MHLYYGKCKTFQCENTVRLVDWKTFFFFFFGMLYFNAFIVHNVFFFIVKFGPINMREV